MPVMVQGSTPAFLLNNLHPGESVFCALYHREKNNLERVNMKTFNIMLATTAIGVLAACQPVTEAADEAEATVDAAVEVAEVEVMDPESFDNYGGYIEYVWLKAGENNSPETFSAFVADWNAATDEAGSEMSAYAYVPMQENENWDGLWVNAFPNKAARNEAWASYEAAGTEAALAAAHPGVIEPVGETYGDNAYGFYRYDAEDLPTNTMTASTGPDQTPYAVGVLACSFNEGQSWDELGAAIETSYIPWLATLDEDTSGYAMAIEVPDFETDQFDYLWKNIHQTAEGAAEGGAAWAETGAEVQAVLESIATCGEQSFSAGYVLRLNES